MFSGDIHRRIQTLSNIKDKAFCEKHSILNVRQCSGYVSGIERDQRDKMGLALDILQRLSISGVFMRYITETVKFEAT